MRSSRRFSDRHLRHPRGRLRLDEDPHLRFAEPVDRLHRIADREHRAPVTLGPPRGQPAQEHELRERGILELVDQQVLDPRIELEQQIGWRQVAAERVDRRDRALHEIQRARVAEGERERCGEPWQCVSERGDDGPRVVAVAWRRQVPCDVELHGEPRDGRELREERSHGIAAFRAKRALPARSSRRKSVLPIQPRAKSGFPGQEQPRRERTPRFARVDARWRQAARVRAHEKQVCERCRARRPFRMTCGVAQQGRQRHRELRREGGGDRPELAANLVGQHRLERGSERVAVVTPELAQ